MPATCSQEARGGHPGALTGACGGAQLGVTAGKPPTLQTLASPFPERAPSPGAERRPGRWGRVEAACWRDSVCAQARERLDTSVRGRWPPFGELRTGVRGTLGCGAPRASTRRELGKPWGPPAGQWRHRAGRERSWSRSECRRRRAPSPGQAAAPAGQPHGVNSAQASAEPVHPQSWGRGRGLVPPGASPAAARPLRPCSQSGTSQRTRLR